MNTIPQEYINSSYDFGFTAVDDPDEIVKEVTPSIIQQTVDTSPILSRIQNLEINVGQILDILERIEQVNTPNLDTDEYKTLIEKDVREKLKNVEAMVMPLLLNLLKDADKKDYIKWPNRKPIIETFIEKFLSVTRS